MSVAKNTSEVWRRFGEHPLTHSMAHYLMAISEIFEEQGYVRATDVAKWLGVTKGSASIALKTIKEKGLVAEDDNRMLFLTEMGEEAVDTIVGARSTFLKFFRDILAIDENIALEDACKLEHLVSRTTSERLMRFIRFTMKDKDVRSHIKKFSQAVADCGTIDECDQCESVDDCTDKIVETVTKK